MINHIEKKKKLAIFIDVPHIITMLRSIHKPLAQRHDPSRRRLVRSFVAPTRHPAAARPQPAEAPCAADVGSRAAPGASK